MGDPTLEQILEQVRGLTPAEQAKVREMLDHLVIGEPTNEMEDAFEKELLEAGIIESSPSLACLDQNEDEAPLPVAGKPASQIIIEERTREELDAIQAEVEALAPGGG